MYLCIESGQKKIVLFQVTRLKCLGSRKNMLKKRKVRRLTYPIFVTCNQWTLFHIHKTCFVLLQFHLVWNQTHDFLWPYQVFVVLLTQWLFCLVQLILWNKTAYKILLTFLNKGLYGTVSIVRPDGWKWKVKVEFTITYTFTFTSWLKEVCLYVTWIFCWK